MKKLVLASALMLATSVFMTGIGASSASAANDTWPKDNVTVVVASSAGGGTDVQARLVGEIFRKHTGYDMVIENQNAASGTVAYEQVRNADPDGYTLLYYHNSLFIAHYSGIYPHNVLDNFEPVGKFCESRGNAVCVPKNSPYNTLEELIAAAKKAPDTIIAGIQIGGFPEYLITLLEKAAGCKFRNVDAGNASNRLLSLIGGYINVACIDPKAAAQHEKNGDLKVLAICSPTHVDAFPNWKSMGELGYPSVVIPNGQLLYAPKGIDPELVKQMNKVFEKIGADPEYREKTLKMGRIPESLNLEQVREAAKAQDSTIRTILSK